MKINIVSIKKWKRAVPIIELEANNFFTQFPPQAVDIAGNLVAITAQAQALP